MFSSSARFVQYIQDEREEKEREGGKEGEKREGGQEGEKREGAMHVSTLVDQSLFRIQSELT